MGNQAAAELLQEVRTSVSLTLLMLLLLCMASTDVTLHVCTLPHGGSVCIMSRQYILTPDWKPASLHQLTDTLSIVKDITKFHCAQCVMSSMR